eukprot:gene2071-7253_t
MRARAAAAAAALLPGGARGGAAASGWCNGSVVAGSPTFAACVTNGGLAALQLTQRALSQAGSVTYEVSGTSEVRGMAAGEASARTAGGGAATLTRRFARGGVHGAGHVTVTDGFAPAAGGAIAWTVRIEAGGADVWGNDDLGGGIASSLAFDEYSKA